MNKSECIIGFDIGIKNGNAYVVLEVGKELRVRSAGYLKDRVHLEQILNTFKVKRSAIEGIPYINNKNVTIRLAYAAGKLMQRLEDFGVRYEVLPVAAWKKALLGEGKGNSSKEVVKTAIMTAGYLPDGYPADCYDACGVAVAASASVVNNSSNRS